MSIYNREEYNALIIGKSSGKRGNRQKMIAISAGINYTTARPLETHKIKNILTAAIDVSRNATMLSVSGVGHLSICSTHRANTSLAFAEASTSEIKSLRKHSGSCV